MKELYDHVSINCSKFTTRTYSTSFSAGIWFLDRKLHEPIYSIYGFVRVADEIVDTFHDYDKAQLLEEFREETWKSIERGISTNPILNSFQHTVNKYKIDKELIECFFDSMATDLQVVNHTEESYAKYILGSAEVVGLMCLKVFTGNQEDYEKLKPAAMKLGAAFQKVNFLRDMKADNQLLGRTYFPKVNFRAFSCSEKEEIQRDIENDFAQALAGIKRLPLQARGGVYLAYSYYRALFYMIKQTPTEGIMSARIRVSNYHKVFLMFTSMVKNQLNLI